MKPQMTLLFRISIDSAHHQRYTEEEIKNEIFNGNVIIKKSSVVGGEPLLVRKGDGAVLGGFLNLTDEKELR